MDNLNVKYRFIAVPSELFGLLRQKRISHTGILLYSVLLNQANMVVKGRNMESCADKVFVYCSYAKLQDILNCSKSTVIRNIRELEDLHLIRRETDGAGKPVKYFVSRFATDRYSGFSAENNVATHTPKETECLDFGEMKNRHKRRNNGNF